MKGSNSSIVPLEPDTYKELEKVLAAGESAKVMLEGSDTIFIMKKAEKGNEYELFQVSSDLPSGEMRKALAKVKDKIE